MVFFRLFSVCVCVHVCLCKYVHVFLLCILSIWVRESNIVIDGCMLTNKSPTMMCLAKKQNKYICLWWVQKSVCTRRYMHLKINWVMHVQHIRGLTFFFFCCVLVSLDMCCGSASGSESDGTIASSSGSRSYCLPPLPTKHSMARCPASMKRYNTTCVNIYPPCLHTNIKVSWRKRGGSLLKETFRQ